MADYYPLISRAVSELRSNTSEARESLYERAREALVTQLHRLDPPMPESQVRREAEALEAAIRRVEATYKSVRPIRPSVELAPTTSVAGRSTPLPVGGRPEGEYDLRKGNQDSHKLASGLKTVGTITFGIVALAALLLLPVIFIFGVVWVSAHVIQYLLYPVWIALGLCLFVFLPLALFRKARIISVYGLFISSYLFGATTWILGLLTTLQYWGIFGLLVGLFLGVVGIVPLGTIAAAFHTDWWAAGGLIFGLFLTFGARALAIRLAISVDKTTETSAPIEALERIPVGDDIVKRTEGTPKKRPNYIARHWRGELPLPVSYWVNGFVGGLLALIVIAALLATADLKNNFRPDVALLVVTSMYASIYLIQIWQAVGIWRSATNYQLRWSKRWWGGIAKVMLILAVLGNLGHFVNRDAPQIVELYKIYNGDERMGPNAFRVLRDGRELEFSGGIKFGTAKEFESFLNAMGAVQVVHLNSIGGRINEARRIGDLIRSRGLNTYVSNDCQSACTIIFLSGRERWISERGRLGFHAPSFPGMSTLELAEFASEEKDRLTDLGVPKSFAEKAMHTPSASMWYPSVQELLSAHIVTGVANPSQFAASGIPVRSISVEEISKTLSGIPVYAAIAKVSPSTFTQIVEELSKGYRVGVPQSEIVASLRPRVLLFVQRSAPYAADDLLLQFNDINIEYMEVLQRMDPESCTAFAVGSSKYARQRIDVGKEAPRAAERELKLDAEIISSGYNRNRNVPLLEDIQSAFEWTSTRLLERVGKTDYEVFLKGDAEPNEFAGFCRASIEFLKIVRALPNRGGVAILRYLYSQLSNDSPPSTGDGRSRAN